MDNFFAAYTEDLALYMPDGMPLLGSNALVEVYTDDDAPAIYMTILLEDISAETLDESGLFGSLGLPADAGPLEPIKLQLDLVAKPVLCQEIGDALREADDPAQWIADQDAPEPVYNIANYELKSWAVHQGQIVPDEVLKLSKRPPKPFK